MKKSTLYMSLVLAATPLTLSCASPTPSATPTPAPAPAGATASAALVEQLEKAQWDTTQKKDWAALNALLAPNFQLVTPNGQYVGKAAAFAYMQTVSFSQYTMSDVQTTIAPTSMVISYKATSDEGGALSSGWRLSSWVLVNGQWLFLSHAVL